MGRIGDWVWEGPGNGSTQRAGSTLYWGPVPQTGRLHPRCLSKRGGHPYGISFGAVSSMEDCIPDASPNEVTLSPRGEIVEHAGDVWICTIWRIRRKLFSVWSDCEVFLLIQNRCVKLWLRSGFVRYWLRCCFVAWGLWPPSPLAPEAKS